MQEMASKARKKRGRKKPGTYTYRNPEKRRAYMRDLMRARRAEGK